MANILGVQNTKEALVFVGSFVTAIDRSYEDGTFSLIFDSPKFLDPAMKLGPALKGADQIDDETLKDEVTVEERAELHQAFAESLDLRNDGIEDLAEEGEEIAVRLVAFFAKVRQRKAEQAATAAEE